MPHQTNTHNFASATNVHSPNSNWCESSESFGNIFHTVKSMFENGIFSDFHGKKKKEIDFLTEYLTGFSHRRPKFVIKTIDFLRFSKCKSRPWILLDPINTDMPCKLMSVVHVYVKKKQLC